MQECLDAEEGGADVERERDAGKKLPEPKSGGSVWPTDSCPVFSPRDSWLPIEKEQCWYCKFANFHLTAPVALEVGICCYPQVQVK